MRIFQWMPGTHLLDYQDDDEDGDGNDEEYFLFLVASDPLTFSHIFKKFPLISRYIGIVQLIEIDKSFTE